MRMAAPAIARRLDPWAPPLVLMAVIFVLSAQPDLNSGLGTIDLVGRKLIHASEYALLTFLWWRALRTVVAPKTAALFAFSLAVGYAGTDEFHQHFIKGRHGTPVDVGIDACGAAISALLIRRRST
jgi:VanZ family protein